MPDIGKSKTVCYLANGPVPSTAANAVHVAHMCEALVDIGCKVTLVDPVASLFNPYKIDHIRRQYGVKGHFNKTSIWTPKMRGGGWLYRKLLRFLLWRLKPDLVFGRNLDGCLVAARSGYSVVFETHMPAQGRGARFQLKFEQLITMPSFRALVVVSAALLKEFGKAYPQIRNRIIVAPDAAPVWPKPSPRVRGSNTDFKVTYVGGLYPGKGIELLVKLAPLCPWAQFTIVGGTRDEVEHWQSALKLMLDNVVFRGHAPHKEVRQYMLSSDVLVAPYQYSVHVHGSGKDDIAQWMSPLKLFEYMSSARPIVASDLPVIREVLRHEHNALLADPEKPDIWRMALERIRSNPNLGVQLAQRAYQEYKRSYTWDVRAKAIVDSIKSISVNSVGVHCTGSL